ncbi:MAG: tetratricopeptide repeat protein [Spirochaetota bacterium]
MSTELSFKEKFDRAVDDIKLTNFERAIKLLTELKEEKPEDVQVLNMLGIAYFNIQRLEAAYLSLKEASKLEPDNETVSHNLGIIMNIMLGNTGCSGCTSRGTDTCESEGGCCG